MRILQWSVTALSFIVLPLFNFPSRALSQDQATAGYIQEVRGGAYVKTAKGKEKLDSKRDLRRTLHPGEVVSVGPGGYVRLKLCSDPANPDCQPKEITSGTEFQIVARPPARTEQEIQHEKAAQERGRSGGRPMGVLSPFYSPAPEGVVRPSTMVLRWVASRELSSLSVVIQNQNHQKLWEKKITNGASGKLDSSELKQILRKYRDEHEKGPLTLEVEDKNRIGSKSKFSLLSIQDEKKLDQELAEWDQETDIFMRHLGRAHAFFVRDMFTDVADEFEAALSETPESRDLLRRTIQAHRDTGNTAREEVLKRRLARK